MASVSWGEIAPAAAARSLAGSFASGTETALHAAIATAINAAIASGLFTTTVSASSYVTIPVAIQSQMVLLEGLGYTVSYSGTTITISW